MRGLTRDLIGGGGWGRNKGKRLIKEETMFHKKKKKRGPEHDYLRRNKERKRG